MSYVGELEFFVALRHSEISAKRIGQVLTFLVSRYHSAENEQNLQAVSTVLNVLLAPQKKKQHPMERALQVLTLVDPEGAQLGEHCQTIREAV